MMRSIGITVVLYALGLAVACIVAGARGRRRSPGLLAGAAILEFGLLIQALLDVVTVFTSGPQPERIVNLGYLVVSVVALPLIIALARMEPGRWGPLIMGLGCVLVAIVSVRLHSTLHVSSR